MDKVVSIVVQAGAVAPAYATPMSAGLDLCAHLNEDMVIPSGSYALVPTGISLALPQGYEAQVRPRSGLAVKFGVTVLNSPGTIDADYRGEIGVLLINHGKHDFSIRNGERIAQLVVAAYTHISFVEVEHLDKTERGQGGFGSTGV